MTPTETFRKFMWFLLRERTFDQEAIEDLVALKAAAGLNDNQVGDALQERAVRCAAKYGALVPSTAGFTTTGALCVCCVLCVLCAVSIVCPAQKKGALLPSTAYFTTAEVLCRSAIFTLFFVRKKLERSSSSIASLTAAGVWRGA